MSEPRHHHYVPIFYLNEWTNVPDWACPAKDGRLFCYSRKHDKLVADPHKPRSTGYELDLYSLKNVAASIKQTVEKTFFSVQVDSPASNVLKTLLTVGVDGLHNKERVTWAIFISSLHWRTPDSMRMLRTFARDATKAYLRRDYERDAGVYNALAEELSIPLQTLLEDGPEHDLWENYQISRGLAKIIKSNMVVEGIARLNWVVYDLECTRLDLLTSDRPLIVSGILGKHDYAIYLPLSPTKLFGATAHPALDNLSIESNKRTLIKGFNVEIASQARLYVYTTGLHHEKLIQKRLSQTYVPPPRAYELLQKILHFRTNESL